MWNEFVCILYKLTVLWDFNTGANWIIVCTNWNDMSTNSFITRNKYMLYYIAHAHLFLTRALSELMFE